MTEAEWGRMGQGRARQGKAGQGRAGRVGNCTGRALQFPHEAENDGKDKDQGGKCGGLGEKRQGGLDGQHADTDGYHQASGKKKTQDSSQRFGRHKSES